MSGTLFDTDTDRRLESVERFCVAAIAEERKIKAANERVGAGNLIFKAKGRIEAFEEVLKFIRQDNGTK